MSVDSVLSDGFERDREDFGGATFVPVPSRPSAPATLDDVMAELREIRALLEPGECTFVAGDAPTTLKPPVSRWRRVIDVVLGTPPRPGSLWRCRTTGSLYEIRIHDRRVWPRLATTGRIQQPENNTCTFRELRLAFVEVSAHAQA